MVNRKHLNVEKKSSGVNEAECCIKQFEGAPVEQESAVKTSPFTIKSQQSLFFICQDFYMPFKQHAYGKTEENTKKTVYLVLKVSSY